MPTEGNTEHCGFIEDLGTRYNVREIAFNR